jgi:hypothetical protein
MAITTLPNTGRYQSDRYSGETYFPKWGRNDKLRKSPIRDSLLKQNAKFANIDGFEAHSYGEINPYKVCEIAISSFSEYPNNSAPWGNWRDYSVNVYENVFLWPQEKVWEVGFENGYEPAWSKLDQKGLLSKVSQISEAARSVAMLTGTNVVNNPTKGRFMSRYKEAPSWTGIKPIVLASNLTFKFRFGQAGIFSGEHEVVRPILALAIPWAPRQADNLNHYLRGPIPTSPAYLFDFLSHAGSIASGLGTAIKDQDKAQQQANEASESKGEKVGIGTKVVQKIVGTLTALEEEIMTQMDNTINRVLSDKGNLFLNIRIGKMIYPPLTVKTVNWKFDMTHTDEYGYPTEGQITLGGLEGILLPTQGYIKSIYPSIPIAVHSVPVKVTSTKIVNKPETSIPNKKEEGGEFWENTDK